MVKRWRRSHEDRSGQPKVFGLGLSRTGTTTLTAALMRLGYRIQHFPTDLQTIRELNAGQTRLSILRHNDGITDITTIPFYKQLDRDFPNSKFVLTLRDPDAWLTSLELLLDREPPADEEEMLADKPEVAAFRRWLRETVYGSNEFDRDKMLAAYQSHCRNVREHFTDRGDDLLEMDIVAGDGYEKLAPFLGHTTINEPMPRLNSKPHETSTA